MKHNTNITIILITMFIVTQLIGLFVINFYNSPDNNLPPGFQPPDDINKDTSIVSILIAFVIAIGLFFVLTKIKAAMFIKLWFFLVTTIAIYISLNTITSKLSILSYAVIITIAIALLLSYLKIFDRNLYVHNFTELLIYPGIAAIFIPIINVLGVIILLLVFSIYDIWAVWHSDFMKNMAKYQIENLKIFTGFFIPYANSKQRLKINQLKQKYKNKTTLQKKLEKSNIKINLAILGGGDVIFPIIAAGAVYIATGSLLQALIISLSSAIALLGLFMAARKGKFYPALPFLTIGIYLGMIVNWILF